MEKQSKTLGYLAITVVAIIYGVSYLARNEILNTGALDATAITLLMLAIMAILFGLYNLISKKSMKIAKKDIPMLVLAGFIGTFCFHTLTNLSVGHVGAGVPSLLFGLAAVFSLITSVVVYKKRTHALSWLAVVLGLVGLWVILGISLGNLADTNFLGYGLAIGSIMAWVAYCFVADKVSDKYEKTVVLFWSATTGVVASIIAMFFSGPINMAAVSANIGTIAVGLAILGVFNATIAYFMNMFAIKQIGVDMANIFLNFMPIATLVAMFILNGTIPKINEVAGGLIIIASVFLLGFAESLVSKKQKSEE